MRDDFIDPPKSEVFLDKDFFVQRWLRIKRIRTIVMVAYLVLLIAYNLNETLLASVTLSIVLLVLALAWLSIGMREYHARKAAGEPRAFGRGIWW